MGNILTDITKRSNKNNSNNNNNDSGHSKFNIILINISIKNKQQKRGFIFDFSIANNYYS